MFLLHESQSRAFLVCVMTTELSVFSRVSSVQDSIGFYECFWIFLMHWEINFNWRNWCHLGDLNANFWSLNWDKRGKASSCRGFIQAVITDQDVQKHAFSKMFMCLFIFGCAGSSLLHRLFCGCGMQGLLSSCEEGSYSSLKCVGFSLQWLLSLQSTGSRACRLR